VGRSRFSDEVREVLEREFCRKEYVDDVDRERIENETGLNFGQIKSWFKKRRTKARKVEHETDIFDT
ncbi:hypothetical protein HELRODRAFT_127983, partial [Helobdella robusta]|uniref:Homeobox domain-containing protein n=1 Tax=Helobdella robusta TaxID=6412 RepID=T1EHK2_HELRO